MTDGAAAATAAAAAVAAVSSTSDISFINPQLFSGTANEDARHWIGYFENWIGYKGIAAENQPRLFPLLFRGTAADWFASLQANEKDTLAHLKTAFEARFFPTALSKWQTMSDIWSRKQQCNETVDEFITGLLKLARIANITDAETLRFAAIKGLNPEIRRHVLQQNPPDLAAVQTAAKIAECAMKSDEPNQFVMAMSRLEEKLDSMTVNPPQKSSLSHRSSEKTKHDIPTYSNESSRSNSPYRNQNRQRQSNRTYSSNGANHPQRDRFADENPNTQRYTSNNRGFNNRARNGPSQQNNNRNNNSSGFSFTNPSGFSFTNQYTCYKCGLNGHVARNCPRDYTLVCQLCKKNGHLSHVCRSAQYYQQP